jgi:hypothetical protein
MSSHTMQPDEIESQASGVGLRDYQGNPLQAGRKYMVNRPGQWAKMAELFEDQVTGDLCLRIDMDGSGPIVQRVDDLARDVIFFLSSNPSDVVRTREEVKERIKELIDKIRYPWDQISTLEAIDEISVLIDQL